MPVRVSVALLPPGSWSSGPATRSPPFSSSATTRTLVPLHDGSHRWGEGPGHAGHSVAIPCAEVRANGDAVCSSVTARGSEIRGTSDQPEVDAIRTQNATSIPEPEREPGKLRVRTVPSAGPRPRSDRQDAPRQRRGVGPRLRLGHRSLRSRARPERPHPNGQHRKHEYPNNHGEHHGHRHHSGAPLLAVSPNPMPQLPSPLFYHDRDRRPATK